MKVGDLVRNHNSESGMLGIIVGLHHESLNGAIVAWNDGRVHPVLKRFIKVISEAT